MLTFAIKTTGWLLAHAPEWLLHLLAAGLGDLAYYGLRRRRRLVLSNLHHAFPERPAAWHRRIARESCRRLIETGFLSLATPFLNEARLRRIIAATPELLACFAEHRAAPAATLICSPHMAYWEAQTSMALVVPGEFPEFGSIFRPLDHPAVDELVKRSRERFGMRLLSRKEGFAEALKILRRRGFVGILFDQNAGLQGALTTVFGRVCSTTELPGLMAEKFRARVFGIYPRRRGFWRVEIAVARIDCEPTSESATIGLNRWLESLLSSDDSACASWLWIHDRWRNQDIPGKRLRLESKRDLLSAELRTRGLAALPRRTRFWIRLPNWLGDVVMVVPLLRALRASRPDAEITVIAKEAFLPLLQSWELADAYRALPPRGPGYFLHFWRLRGEFPDVWLLLTNSFRGDLEARLAGCRQRFGVLRAGKSRPLLSHAYRLPEGYDETAQHQFALWDGFFRHFGLGASPDRSPLAPRPPHAGAAGPVGLIPGSENNPEKRWPVAHWRRLIEANPDCRFVLFGTPNDRAITTRVAEGFDSTRVENVAGQTSLVEFAARLQGCRLLVTNDTGGMHLANALGVPLLALFGPTNPVRTGPVFAAPARILQPPGCPPGGGVALAKLDPETVVAALHEELGSPRC